MSLFSTFSRSATISGAAPSARTGHSGKPLDLPALVLAAGRLSALIQQGQHGARRVGSGENFWQFRPHLSHEPANLVDWRQSARSADPKIRWVREREHDMPRALCLWVDLSASMQWSSQKPFPTKASAGMTAALALAGSALRAGERVLISGQQKFYQNSHHLPQMAQVLATQDTNLPDIANAPPHAPFLIVSDFLWDKSTMAHITRLCRQRPGRCFLLAVQDPAERDLPYQGHVRFLDTEGGTPLVLSAVEHLAEAYHTTMTAHFANLQAMMGPHMSLTLYQTDTELLPALLRLHQQLGTL